MMSDFDVFKQAEELRDKTVKALEAPINAAIDKWAKEVPDSFFRYMGEHSWRYRGFQIVVKPGVSRLWE